MIANSKTERYMRAGIIPAWIFMLVGLIVVAWFVTPFVLWLSIPITLICVLNLIASPLVYLNEDGVSAKYLFTKKTYQWDSILQVGILWRVRRGIGDNELIIVKPGGSKRTYQDTDFLKRNTGKLVYLRSYSQQNLEFVISHYGSLDFDLSDNKRE